MLTRLYIDNFRGLVNFEIKLNALNLFLGANGSGKTSVLEVIYRLQQFLQGDKKVSDLFSATELTRWQTSPIQRFEMDLQLGEGNYQYSLQTKYDKNNDTMLLKQEKLLQDGHLLFEITPVGAQLYHDDFSEGAKYFIPGGLSGVGCLPSSPDTKKLTRFRKEIEKFIVVTICPMTIGSESAKENRELSRTADNFVSWYRFLSQEHQASLFDLMQELREVIPGFSSFTLKEAGENTRVMKALMTDGVPNAKPVPYDLKELSDGQRVLIVLYTLLHGLKTEGIYLFLDEPENYVALREIQPWLVSLADACGQGIAQAVLTSHHPEVINYLAASNGKWFERENNGPVRVSDQPRENVDGLSPAETIARGWNA